MIIGYYQERQIFMTSPLQQAIEALQNLPQNEQNIIAERILEEIEELEWDAIVSKPSVKKRLRELSQEAHNDYLAGNVRSGGFGKE
jgi:hypothetical protein